MVRGGNVGVTRIPLGLSLTLNKKRPLREKLLHGVWIVGTLFTVTVLVLTVVQKLIAQALKLVEICI